MSSHAEESRIRPGMILAEKWHIDELLGEGGMATVWSATHRNGLQSAIKVLRQELSGNKELVRRFLREGYVANRIDHPGVVKVLDDHVTDDGIVFFVMERLVGESVESRWEAYYNQLPPKDVVEIAIGVLEVLEVAHAAGVVHRDLKPDNIFLLESGQVKLLDFGIARLREVGGMDSKTKTGAMMGTPAFMPPEQALGYWDEVNERSDLYAVGATMWTLLSGDSVHRSNTVQELLVAACTKQAKPIRNELPHLGEGVANVIDKALRFESDDRWASAKEMLQALRALDGVTDVVKPPTRSSAGASSLVGPMSTLPAGFKTTAAPTTTHSTPGRRRRRGLFAALGAVALLTFAGGYFVTMSREASVAPVAAPTAVTAEAPPVQPSPAAPARTTAAPAVSVAPSAPPAASSAALPKPVARPKPTTVAPKPSAAKPKCDDMFDPRCL